MTASFRNPIIQPVLSNEGRRTCRPSNAKPNAATQLPLTRSSCLDTHLRISLDQRGNILPQVLIKRDLEQKDDRASKYDCSQSDKSRSVFIPLIAIRGLSICEEDDC